MSRRRPKPLVFISHSSRDDAPASKVLKAIVTALEAAGIEPLVDNKGLEAGVLWRNRLHTWMEHCHGAVLLLSRKALQSRWVLQEATILTARQYRLRQPDTSDKGFRLVPVFVDISAEDVERFSDFKELQLPLTQGLRSRSPVETGRKVAALLARLKQEIVESPRRQLEAQIAENLKPAGAKLLSKVTASLGKPVSPWTPTNDVAEILASRLLEASPAAISAALAQLVNVLSKKHLQDLVEKLGTVWVRPGAPARLATIARGRTERRAALLNASRVDFTPASYVFRAAGSAAVNALIPIAEGSGEDSIGSIVAQVNERFWAIGVPRGDQTTLRAVLQKLAATVPVVIALPEPKERVPLIDEAEVRRLLQAFEHCTVLVLTGRDLPPDTALSGIPRLTPALDEGEEREAFESHLANKFLTQEKSST